MNPLPGEGTVGGEDTSSPPDAVIGRSLADPELAAPSPGNVLDSAEAGGAAVRGGALRTAGYLLNALLGAVSAAFLFRHLSVDEVGFYVTATSLTTIVGGVSDLGLTALGLRELSVRDGEARVRLMRNLLGLRVVLTLTGLAIILAFSLVAHYPGVLVAGVAVTGFALLFQSLQGTLALSLMSRLKLGWVTAGEVGRQAALAILIVLLVLGGARLLAFFALQVPVAVAALAFTAWLVRRDVSLRPSFHRHEWREMLRDILPFSVAVALGVIYFRVSVIAVSLVANHRELGYFSVSFRILEVLVGIPALMVTAAFPIFARSAVNDRERFAYALSRVFVVSLIIGVWFVLGLAFGARIAIELVGGSKFPPSAGVLRLQAIGLGGSFVAVVWNVALISLGRLRAVMYMSLLALIAGSILAAALAATHGARGAAVGMAITEISLAIVGALLVRGSGSHLLPAMNGIPRIALAGVVAAGVTLLSGVPPIAAVLLSSVIYFSLLLMLGAVPEEALHEVRRLRRPGRAS